jgi:hypothetical protein
MEKTNTVSERSMGIFDGVNRLRNMGFSMSEVMTGDHEFEHGLGPAGRRFFEFKVRWGPKNVSDWLNPGSEAFGIHHLEGTVTAEGLCHDTRCEGTLELHYLTEHKIRYRFDFAAEGKRYRYVGEKVNIQVWNLPVAHTTCFGRITEAETGRLVSTSVTYFRLKTLPAFVTSLRLRLGE